MIENQATNNYLMPEMMADRTISSREGLILFLIIIALCAAVFGSIITP